MSSPRRRTLAALGAAVLALHGVALWPSAPPARAVSDPVAVQRMVLAPRPAEAPPARVPPAALAAPVSSVAPAPVAPRRAAAPEVAAAPPSRRADPPPTAVAPALRLRYRLERGDGPAGEAELDWQPEGDRYEARLLWRPAGGRVVEQASSGALGPAGLVPARFVDRRAGRAMAVNFQAERSVVGFSGPALELPLPEGAQDRLSWILQLAARVHADPAAAAAGVVLPVFGARGDAGVWHFERAADADAAADGLLRLRRVAAGPYDGAVEVWLDPAQHHLPARLALHAAAGDARPALVLVRDNGP